MPSTRHKQRSRRALISSGTALHVHIPSDLIGPLDAWIQRQPADLCVTRPEIVRFAVRG